MLHTAGLGFLIGVDIYDCVVVINSQKALDAFSAVRCTLGGEISAVAGPVGVGGVLETEVHKRQAPVFTYLKSRGFYAGVQIDGTIIIERTDENERFYGERIGVKDILAGKVRHPPYETRRLLETIKSAQGDLDIDQSLIPMEPPPADFELEQSDQKSFGIPAKEDPDPFGVLALENAGLEIREAGTNKRPTSAQFEFHPSPTSPIYTTFRKSLDQSSIDGRSMGSKRSSWRTSTFSSVERSSRMVDMSTQTEFDAPKPISIPPLPPRPEQKSSPNLSPRLPEIPESKSIDEAEPASVREREPVVPEKPVKILTEEIVLSPEERKGSANDNSKQNRSARDSKGFYNADFDDDNNNEDENDDDDDDEEVVIQEIQQAAAPQVVTRARMVTVPKAIPPKLPPRNPFRKRLSVNSDVSNEDSMRDIGAGPSPLVSNGQSRPSTPSLKNDVSSASSQHSISSAEGFERVGNSFQPRLGGNDSEKADVKDDVISRPESPVKHVPGGFN